MRRLALPVAAPRLAITRAADAAPRVALPAGPAAPGDGAAGRRTRRWGAVVGASAGWIAGGLVGNIPGLIVAGAISGAAGSRRTAAAARRAAAATADSARAAARPGGRDPADSARRSRPDA